MTDPSTWPDPDDQPPADRSIVRTLIAEQGQLFREGFGPSVADYVNQHPFLARDPEALLDLIRNEISLRGAVGDPDTLATLAEYETRFPELASSIRDLADESRRTLDPSSAESPTTRKGPEDTTPPTRMPPPGVPERRAQGPGWPSLDGYEIVGVLGEGGMGIVYRAFDRRRGVAVAVKTIRQGDAASVSRFKREFRALLDVSHPNLVTLHELISDGQTWFIVMEHVEGRPFLDYVRRGPGPPGKGPGARRDPRPAAGDPESRARLRSAARQLAEGLAAVHRGGKLHRDIKPSNVLVTPQGRVVLMDFGLVIGGERDDQDHSTGGGVVGTPAYMAPEQATGVGTNEASDWYSVGVMLYEALTGRLPFQGGMLQVLMDKQRFEPPPPHELVPDVPEDLDVLCEELLRRDPLKRPAGPTILARLGGPSPAEGTPAGPPERLSSQGAEAVFLGRESHRAALADALRGLARGRPILVFVRGPSGVGKSALIREFLDGLGGEVVALSGRCYDRESVPYKALDSLIDALGQHLRRLPPHEVREFLPRDVAALARVFPALRRVEAIAASPARGPEVPDPRELRRRSAIALRELLARIGDRRPLVLAIDDLQWGDQDSLAVLSEVLRPPDPPVLLLVCGFRSEEAEASPFLRGLLAGPWEGVECRTLDVGPLSMPEATALARHLLGGSAPERQAEAIARESGGSPFFVAELTRSLQAGGPDLAEGTRPANPIALDEVLWSRVLRLPDDALRLLRMVAVSGGPLPTSVAWQALGGSGDERSTLAVLRAGRMVRAAGGPSSPDGERIETYHDRIREAVVARLSPEELSSCHRRLAHALEASSGADSEVLGVHFRGAGEPGKAGEYFARAAAGAAEALAFDRAAKLYRLALDLLRPAPAERRELRVALGEALANAGRGADAAREYLAACEGATVAEALEFRRKAAMQLLISGHIDRGLATLRDVLGAVGLSLPATPRRSLASLLFHRALLGLRGLRFRPRDTSEVSAADLTRIDVCWSAGVGLSNVDWVRGADFQARGLLLALRAGEPRRIGRALSVEAAQSATGGVSASARTARLLARARELSGGDGQPYAAGMVILAEGVSAYLEGRWRDALEACDRAQDTFRDRCTGVAWELDTAHAYALWALSHLGLWGEVSRRFPVLIAEARERGDLYAEMNLSTYILAIVRLAADRPDEAREDVRRVMAHWSGDGYHVQHNDQIWGSTLVDLYLGDGPSAWARITGHWPTLARSLLLRVQFIRVAMLGLRARSALAAADAEPDPRRGPWLRSAAKDAARLDRERMPWAVAQARVVRAGLAMQHGRVAEAHARLREARELFLGADMAICAAVVDMRLGEVIGGEEGRSFREAARARIVAQAVARPSKVADLFAPGFRRGRRDG